MILDPPYNNGVDPPIFETALQHALDDREWKLHMRQPRVEPTPGQIARSAARLPFTTGRDEYGIRGWHTSKHTHMLPTGGSR